MKSLPLKSFPVLAAAVMLAGFSGCDKRNTPGQAATGRPLVATVNYPLAYFAERIGGEHIDIQFPAMDGDPAFWEPGAEEVIAFQQADLVLLNGADYAKWVPKVSLAQAKLVNTSAGLGDSLIPLENEVTHAHGPEGDHAHGDTAITTWLDPQIATRQTAAIRDAFVEKWPEHKNDFESGYQALASDLKAIDAAAAAAFKSFGKAPLLGSHPVYQYLARRFGINLKSLHWEPDAQPDQAMWRDLDELLATHPAQVMLWEAAPLPQVAEQLAAKGIRSIVFDPCGNRPTHGDYLETMRDNISNLH